jgi:hypothetical protein
VTQKISTETPLLPNLRVVTHKPNSEGGFGPSNRSTAVGLLSVWAHSVACSLFFGYLRWQCLRFFLGPGAKVPGSLPQKDLRQPLPRSWKPYDSCGAGLSARHAKKPPPAAAAAAAAAAIHPLLLHTPLFTLEPSWPHPPLCAALPT